MALPGPGISSRGYDGIGTSGRDGGVTPFGVIDAVGGDAADPLLHRDLRQQVGQNGRIADTVAGHLDGSHFQRISVDTDVDLAPLPAAAGSMFTNLPLAFP